MIGLSQPASQSQPTAGFPCTGEGRCHFKRSCCPGEDSGDTRADPPSEGHWVATPKQIRRRRITSVPKCTNSWRRYFVCLQKCDGSFQRFGQFPVPRIIIHQRSRKGSEEQNGIQRQFFSVPQCVHPGQLPERPVPARAPELVTGKCGAEGHVS